MVIAQSIKTIRIAALKVACATCSLRELCLPFGLSEDDVDKLDAIVNHRQRIETGQHLYRAGDGFQSLYAIRIGSFKTYEVNRDGREQVNGFHLTGELIGLDAISAGTHACGAAALEDGEVCEIPFSKLEALARKIPALQHQFHRLMSGEISDDHRFMMVLGTLSAEERMATFLLNLSRRAQVRRFSPSSINITMKREEIGNYLGLTLETVSRMLSRLQDDGLIEIGRRSIGIKNLEGLKKTSEFSRPHH